MTMTIQPADIALLSSDSLFLLQFCKYSMLMFCRPTGIPGNNEAYNLGMVSSHGLEPSHTDTFSSVSREGTLMIREVSGWYLFSEQHLQEVLSL